MAFELIDNISYKGAKFLDNRKSAATTTVLLNWNFVTVPIPEGFKVYCTQTAKWYIYRSSNTRSAITGFFIAEDEVLEANLQAVVSRLDAVEPVVALNTQNIAAARQDIETLQSLIARLQQSVTTINTQLATLNDDVTALAANYREQQEVLNAIVGDKTACKGYFQTLASLLEAYPTTYDGDFAYVMPTDPNQTSFNIYRFNGSTQQWVASGTAPMITTPSIQGLLATNDLPVVNASLYDSGLQVGTVTVYNNFQQFIDAEAAATPVLPVAMRKRGMVVFIAVLAGPSGHIWIGKQFRGTDLTSHWTNSAYWTSFPADFDFPVDPLT
jgi:hypothetical protein